MGERGEWPNEWFFDGAARQKPRFTDPVCLLHRALYGHPDAGTYWEQHAEEHLGKVGFVPIQDWKSCFRHPRLNLMLIVYVDDILLLCQDGAMRTGWLDAVGKVWKLLCSVHQLFNLSADIGILGIMGRTHMCVLR